MVPSESPKFPLIYRDFVKMFPDESSCVTYLVEQLRWSDGFVCPACQRRQEPWRQTRGRLVCPACHHQTTVTAGTIFDKTRTLLTHWFDAAWHMTTTKNGVSAKPLERTMGISDRVAWTMLHRFRVAMVRSARELLSGEVEVDETMIGGVETGGKRGRGATKEIIAIAVEIKRPKGFGRIRMRHIPDASAKNLGAFVRETITSGSVLYTDDWKGYYGLSNEYEHHQTILSSSDDPAHVAMPGVHQVASLLKRWLLGTHQGALASEHFQSYLEEFTFRFNRRTSHRRGQLFYRLLEQAVVTPPVTESDIYGRLVEWEYEHKTVCHSHGEYARDEDGDGFYEVHVNTMEGFWSLLCSWLRPHRGVSQERWPLYVGFFQFVHNVRRRGKALLRALVPCLFLKLGQRSRFTPIFSMSNEFYTPIF